MNFDVDLVYLWVDGHDAAWQRKHDLFVPPKDAAPPDETSFAANADEARFADNDELRYSLRSAMLYAPWIRRIFIVTDGQTPRWLDTSHPKIRIVDHTDILPPEALPTFNSNVIEHALFRIPGLAEHFLYANDDTFFNRPVTPADFFTPDGRPFVRLSRRPLGQVGPWLKYGVAHRPMSHYNRALDNSARLVAKRFGRYVAHKPHHNIDAYSRSSFEQFHEMFRADLEPTMANRMRSDNDIQRALYSYAGIVTGVAVPAFVTRATSFRLHTHKPKHYVHLARLNPLLFCLNDSEWADNDDRRRVGLWLRDRFPQRAPWELPEA